MTSLSLVFVLLGGAGAWFLGADPLKLSAAAGARGFRPQYVAPPAVDPFQGLPRDSGNKLQGAEVRWRGEFVGPESVAFDPQGRGPYTGVFMGRVMRYDGPELGWSTFAYTSKNRSEVCAPQSPPAVNQAFEHVCGRPLGLRFHQRTGDLWIADAYFGIMKVGPAGGQAEPVVDAVDGVPLKFTNDLDLDDDGVVYFTESSTKWDHRQFLLAVLEGDNTGRFLKYDPATKKTTVLIDHLRFANGVAVSKDSTFVLIAETRTGRLLRYWLKGAKAGTHETFAELPGLPDNVRRNGAGDFWVPVHKRSEPAFLGTPPWVRYLAVHLPIPMTVLYRWMAGAPHAMVLRYGPDGAVKEVLEDQTGEAVKLVSEVLEHDGKLYLGSALLPQLAVYTLPSTLRPPPMGA